MEVQIPGVLGRTLLHWRRPPDLVCDIARQVWDIAVNLPIRIMLTTASGT